MQISMACDYPGCGNPISARCNLCGRAMCTRHIQWIGTQGSNGVYTSAHYRCDICANYVALANQAKRKRAITILLIAVALGVASFILMQIGGALQMQATNAYFSAQAAHPGITYDVPSSPLGSILTGLSIFSCFGAIVLFLVGMALASLIRR